MANTLKQPKTHVQVLRWIEKQIEYLQALLIISKKDDSYVIEHLQACNKFYKEWHAIKKVLKL